MASACDPTVASRRQIHCVAMYMTAHSQLKFPSHGTPRQSQPGRPRSFSADASLEAAYNCDE